MPTEPTSDPVLSVEHLSVDFRIGDDWLPAVDDVSFHVNRGEVLAIVGESGSGKTVSSMSVLGLLPDNARRSGEICFDGRNLLELRTSELREIRGKRISMIFQEPMTALNPVYTIGEQIVEAIRCHESVSKGDARGRALELLTKVGIPEPQRRIDSYPHQLSGGQRQRAMIAMAICESPELIIADEPTTALDVTVQAEILELLRRLQKDLGAAVIMITHDMGVVADLADRVVVMRQGRVVEQAEVGALFAAPQHDYTRRLLAAVPRRGSAETGDRAGAPEPADAPVLRISGLEVEYPGRGGRPTFKAVSGVDLQIDKGKVLGLVGESGSGKSTIGRAVVGLVPASDGRIEVAGQDVSQLTSSQLRTFRSKYSMVFQDPGSSLNPRRSIGDSIAAPMRVGGESDRAAIRGRVHDLLEQVELPTDWIHRYPHELSGGQRQRVGIARALAMAPDLLIADEPTSALDVSVQATVLSLIQQLQQQLGFACLFISHDLGVVESLSYSVVVLQHGLVVESGTAAAVLQSPQSAYTRRLIAAAPVPDPVEQAQRRTAWQRLSA